jgi:hypothetical protein
LLNRFLARLDWKKNPFLRSPDAMKKFGFEGTPWVEGPLLVQFTQCVLSDIFL